MALFFGSKTYKTLEIVETGLCYEMFEVIYGMFLDEMSEL